MTERMLSSLQVAALLISASYGIGFLFGSGELAVAHGMAGSIYGVATALGMLVLAVFAKRLWKAGVPIWVLFGQAYGLKLQGAVALLSLVWMAGVLAAQIQGGVAVISLLGVHGLLGSALVLILIFGVSRLPLHWASRILTLCLLASSIVLLYALVIVEGTGNYLDAAPAFADDLATFSTMRWVSTMLAVGILVCFGADYQQFVLAARRPLTATLGCLLASLGLLVIAFLPPALIVTMSRAGWLDGATDAKQVVPLALTLVAETIAPGTDKLLLVALSAAALGSGAAIVRAMSSAFASIAPGRLRESHPGFAVVALAIGAAVAVRDQGIVDTMVSLNVIYIASIAVVFGTLLSGFVMRAAHAAVTMAVGFAASFVAYSVGWLGWLGASADVISLAGGLGASSLAALFLVVYMGAGLSRSAARAASVGLDAGACVAPIGPSCRRASRTTSSVISRDSGGSSSQ